MGISDWVGPDWAKKVLEQVEQSQVDAYWLSCYLLHPVFGSLMRLQYALAEVDVWQEEGGYDVYVEEMVEKAISDLTNHGLW